MNDDFDIDNIFDENKIKPLTSGLGFEKPSRPKRKAELSLSEKKRSLEKDLIDRSKRLKRQAAKPLPDIALPKKAKPKSQEMGDLAPFYAEPAPKLEVKQVLTEKKVLRQKPVQRAKGFERVGAFVVDILLLISSFSMAFISAFFIIDIPLRYVTPLLSDPFNLGMLTAFFSTFFVFYFSFFDATFFSTIGKRIFNLKVQTESGMKLGFMRSLLRSVLSLLSPLTLGLISLLDFHSSFTETEVVKEND